MSCRFTYKGKEYSQDQLAKVLRDINPDEASKYIPNVQSMPTPPFEKTWPDLGLKRMLHRAATEKNPDGSYKYDSLSWTPGQAQADRYDLSKHIDHITMHHAEGEKGGVLQAFDKNGKIALSRNLNDAEKELPDFIGKDAAENLLKQKSKDVPGSYDKVKRLNNADLKIGGEGMKSFYDKMMVDKVNSIVKKYNTKTENTRVGVPHKNGIQGQEFHIPMVKITPELRNAASKGFPTFSDGGRV